MLDRCKTLHPNLMQNNKCPTSHKLGKIWEVNQEVVIFCVMIPCVPLAIVSEVQKVFHTESTLGNSVYQLTLDLVVGHKIPVTHTHIFLSHINGALLQVLRDPAFFWLPAPPFWVSRQASQVVLVVMNPPAKAGDIKDTGLIPGLGRSPGGGKGNPLQCSCLENPMDRGT